MRKYIILTFCLAWISFLSPKTSSIANAASAQGDDVDNISELALNGADTNVIKAKLQSFAVKKGMRLVRVTSLATFRAAAISGNTIMEITKRIDLKGNTFEIPGSSILYFNKGMLRNGSLVGKGARVVSSNVVIFDQGVTKYRGYMKSGSYDYVTARSKSLVIDGTWNNKVVGNNWTGLKSGDNSRCYSLALNNHIRLYDPAETVMVPKGVYYIYDWVRARSSSIDFQGSSLISIDFGKVEDRTVAIPQGCQANVLRSRYGLLDINATRPSVIKNLVMDGRASYRKEEPKLGSECLISIAKNEGGSLENVVLKDAVDCFICTGAIKDFTFRNVTFDKCGEHGLYTHAYDGYLRFIGCKFIDCGQSPSLYKIRGLSGCVRGSGSREHSPSSMKNFKVEFTDCEFSCSGEYAVATLYVDIPNARFDRCVWKGIVRGYVCSDAAFSEQYGKLYQYDFYDCDNPCGNYNSKNAVRTLIRCKNVVNPFNDTRLVQDCDIVSGYDDVVNRYVGRFANEVKTPVSIVNCTFRRREEDKSIRSSIVNPRPMVFKNCKWNFKAQETQKSKGQAYIYLKDEKGNAASCSYINFEDCVFNLSEYRLIDCRSTTINLNRCSFENAGWDQIRLRATRLLIHQENPFLRISFKVRALIILPITILLDLRPPILV